MLRKIILLMGIIATGPAYAAANCDAVLQHGLWNSRYYSSEYDRSTRAKDWYCNHYRQEFEGSSESDAFLGIEELGLDFGFSDESDQQQLTVRDVCEENSRSEDIRLRVDQAWSTASDVIVGAWLQCQKQDSDFEGVRAWTNMTQEPDQFDLELRFASKSDTKGATISSAIIQGGNCISPSGLKLDGSSSFLLERNGVSALCDRCPGSQVRIAFASSHAINGGKQTTTLTIPAAAEPPVGNCQVVVNKPVDTWTFNGECIGGGGWGTVNNDNEDRDSPVDYTVGVSAPDKLGTRCGGYVCTPNGTTGNGCGFEHNISEDRPTEQLVHVRYWYNSHTIHLGSSYQRLVYQQKSEPSIDAQFPVIAGRLFSISYPAENNGVSVVCNIGGDAFEFDPRTDFSNERLAFVSRTDGGTKSIVTFRSTDNPKYACPSN